MKCPGQDTRFWGHEAIFEAHCPKCEAPVEFFKDESSRKCRRCGHRVLNPNMDFGCAAYCKYAEECLGEISPELLAKRAEMLKDRVAAEVKRSLGRDFKRIGRALKVAEFSREIQREEGGDEAVVILAAYLESIRSGNAAPGQSPADILARAGAPYGLAGEVLAILEGKGAQGGDASSNFRCFHDAKRIADLAEGAMPALESGPEISALGLLTETGRKIATRVLAGTGPEA
ncbi:MAG: phosphohydrolase [Desulfobacteraceae bacterium]|nr:phosphohydrolase [Desulfobacteraceae bacterium]